MSGISSSLTKSLLELLDEHPVKIRCVISCIDLILGLFCQRDGPHSAKVIACYLFDFISVGAFRKFQDVCICEYITFATTGE